jgi:D-galactose 1-dehydrogenase
MDIAIVGAGKIAADQHVPALAASGDFRLVAAASPAGRLHGLAHFPSLAALLAEGPKVDAVAVCTPPQVRHAVAREALLAGKHVLLEKPPGATVSEVQDLVALARRCGRSLYAAWHSRHAPGVEPARAWLADRRLIRADIVWREDVRRWHPGHDWIFEAGGLGVFDPGVNALSIASRILPPFFVKAAALSVPAGRAAPIAAALAFEIEGGAPMTADFDFRQVGPQTWDLTAETADGQSLRLSQGGAALALNGRDFPLESTAEYAAVYRRFAQLIAEGGVDVDLRPLQLVADAFLLGRHSAVEAFAF